MIDFRCKSCGKNIRVKDDLAGSVGKCPACGQRLQVPEAPLVAGIRIEPDPTTSTVGQHARPAPASVPEGRFTLAEASCNLWKKGGLANQNAGYPVANLGLDGMTLLYGLAKRPGTIATAPRRPSWEPGTQLEAALTVGAFATPMRMLLEVVDIADRSDGRGCHVDLKIVETTDETNARLQMLADHEDMRMRRKTGMFGSSS